MALQSKNPDNEPPDMEELLNDLGHRLDRLKQLYEMYFLGIEKLEPQVARKEVQRTMLMLQQMNIRNTGLRFKLNALVQKWNIYQTYWGRTVREMENGTYVRHLQRMRRNAERDGKELPAEVIRIRERLLAGGAAALEPEAATKPTAATGTQPPAAKPSSGYDEFDSMKSFLDDETGDFPRVEDDEQPFPPRQATPVAPSPLASPPRAMPAPPPSPSRVAAPPSASTAPPQRASSQPLPPAPPRPPATTPPALANAPQRASSQPLPPAPPRPAATIPPPRAASQPVPPAPPPSRAPSQPAPPPPRAPASAASPPPTAEPRPAAPATPKPAATIPGMNESELRALHQNYVAAKQSTGDTSKVSYEGLVGSLAKQLPRILEQPGVKGVKFEVVTKDGKPIVKAIPQK